MELVWILFFLCAAISTASHIDTRYGKGRATGGSIHNNLSLGIGKVPVIASRDVNQSHELSSNDDRPSKNLHGRVEHLTSSKNDLETPLTRLERRGRRSKKKSKEKKQSAGDKNESQLRSQRSGSSHHLANSASTNSLGVEDRGVAKVIPKRNSEKQLDREQSTDLLRSLGAKSTNDLRTLDPSKGSRDSLFAWANQRAAGIGLGSAWRSLTKHTMAGRPSPPTPQGHQMAGAGFGAAHGLQPPGAGFGSGSGLHNMPAQGGFSRPWRPPTPTNSKGSSRSGSDMSIDMGEEFQARPMQRLNAVSDLTMIDAMPYARQRMRIGDKSPSTSEGWPTSSGDESSGRSRGRLSP